MTMEDFKLVVKRKIDECTNAMRLEMLRAELELRDWANKADNEETRERMIRRADALKHHARPMEEKE